jgi:hypothetical protein
MDPNPIDPGIGSIFGGLALVFGLGLIVLLAGIWVVAQFRRGRVNEETDISYPSVPQSADDRRAVAEVRERERAVGDHHGAAGAGMREVPQMPTRAERPADAEHRRGVDPVGDADSTPRNPL